MICPRCGKENLEDNKFCMFCGKELVTEEPKEESISVRCTKCGAEVRKESVFCPVCGNKLVEEKIYCPRCGKENSSNADFCEVCNLSLEKYKTNKQIVINNDKPVLTEKKGIESAIIIGIISVCIVLVTCIIPLISNLAGIVLGIIGTVKGTKIDKPEAKSLALVLNIIGIIINVAIIIMVVFLFNGAFY